MKFKVWALLFLLTILLALGTALLIGITQSGAGAQPAQTALPKPGGVMTAKQAYETLQEWSKTWAPDAEVSAISASLLKSEGEGQWWSFQVYSKLQQRLGMVLIQPNQVWLLREAKAVYPQKIIDQQAWKLDSDDFLSEWWSQRGSTLWKTSDAQSMHVHLGTQKDNTLIWQISLMNTSGDLIEYWVVSADTGEVLSSGVSGGNE